VNTPHLHHAGKELLAGDGPSSGLSAAVAVGVSSVVVADGAKLAVSFSSPSKSSSATWSLWI